VAIARAARFVALDGESGFLPSLGSFRSHRKRSIINLPLCGKFPFEATHGQHGRRYLGQ
jgi:hypothetical protein